MAADLQGLAKLIGECRSADYGRFLSAYRRLNKQPSEKDLTALLSAMETSVDQVNARRQLKPRLEYPEALPVSQRREEIIAALKKSQVVVICGETGSGKTTQLPKMLLEAGCGARGLIGHTQPRRLAARSVAQRLADEMATELGQLVGYQVRFNDQVSDNSVVKLMTDGILLAETRNDRFLSQYDAIIIDEAHERSLNIDFLLGYLKQLLPKRPDLKVVITSATIDPKRFAKFFNDAPMLLVEGRRYPVEQRYMSLQPEGKPEIELEEGILQAVKTLWREQPGDALVFLPGEREIRDTADYLSKAGLSNTEILPLYARLATSAQNKIFQPGSQRRVVLATNVAETSITVPGIKHVIDSGLARLSRYSYRSKLQRLPIEQISQASANQRAGRCGRTAPGVCIRLYDEDSFLNQPGFTEPEIQRTNLASVLLKMYDLRLGEIEKFPFIDAPDGRYVRDGVRLLEQLSALQHERLTPLGRQMAALPVDPRVARILLAGAEQGCLAECLVLASGLSIMDPRERPADKQQAADTAHSAYHDPQSDFMSWIKLWLAVQAQRKALGSSAFNRWCRQEFLHPLRVREWADVYKQLKQSCADLGLKLQPLQSLDDDQQQSAAEERYKAVHQALMLGLSDRIVLKDEVESKTAAKSGHKAGQAKKTRKPIATYSGGRSLKCRIFPGSGLKKAAPQWLMAWEVVETSQVYARTVAAIQPEWIPQVLEAQLKYQYFEPHWSKRRGHCMAYRQSNLNGLVVEARKPVVYDKIDPAIAREIFIRDALVSGEWPVRVAGGKGQKGLQGFPPFLKANLALVRQLEEEEARLRRRDLLVDERKVQQFYAEVLPPEVVNAQQCWMWSQQGNHAENLALSEALLRQADSDTDIEQYFPKRMQLNNAVLKCNYAFEPGKEQDGLTLDLPAALVPQMDATQADWLVPGLLEEKVVTIIRGLPKALRKKFVPAPDFAAKASANMAFGEGDFYQSMALQLQRLIGAPVDAEALRAVELPEHLQMRYRLLDGKGKTVAISRDIQQLQSDHQDVINAPAPTMAKRDYPWLKSGLSNWEFGDLPESETVKESGVEITAWPRFADRGNTVDVKLFHDQKQAQASHKAGLRRLVMLAAADVGKQIQKTLQGDATAAKALNLPAPNGLAAGLLAAQYGSRANANLSLAQELFIAAVEQVFFPDPAAGNGLSQSDFAQRLNTLKPEIYNTAMQLWRQAKPSVEANFKLRRDLEKLSLKALHAATDIQGQLQQLVFKGFILFGLTAANQHHSRYLKALTLRLERLANDPQQDRKKMLQIAPYWQQLLEQGTQNLAVEKLQLLEQYRWAVEEFRVSLFAQNLGTAQPVSAKKLDQLWSEFNG